MAESLRCKVEKHLVCSVCLEQFKDPKVLPCLHSFCYDCLVNLVKDAPSKTVKCPECRIEIQVEDKTLDTFPSNFFINNLLATMALTTDDEPVVVEIICDNCVERSAAQNRCNDCGMFLCPFCTKAHKRSLSTQQHELLTIEQMKSNPSLYKTAEKMKCAKHKEEVIKLFCSTCQTTICRDCTIVDHQGHKYGFVEEVVGEEKQRLQRNLDEVEQRKDRVVKGIENLKDFNEGLTAKKLFTVFEINKHFEELATAVECRREELVDQAISLTEAKQKQIMEQLDILEVASATCESSIEFTKQALGSGNDVQVLSMEKYILQSLEQLKTGKDQTEPYVTNDLKFVIYSSVQDTKRMLLNKYYLEGASKPWRFRSGRHY